MSVFVCIYMHMCMFMWLCLCLWVCICMCAYENVYVSKCMCDWVCVFLSMCIYVKIRTTECVYACEYVSVCIRWENKSSFHSPCNIYCAPQIAAASPTVLRGVWANRKSATFMTAPYLNWKFSPFTYGIFGIKDSLVTCRLNTLWK